MKYQWGSCSCLITIEWSQWNCIVYISMSTWHKSLNNIATEDSNEVPEQVVQRNEENPKEECILKKMFDPNSPVKSPDNIYNQSTDGSCFYCW